MKPCYNTASHKIIRSIFLGLFSLLFSFSVMAQQADRPFSVELNAGGGLIGNSTTNTAFQPELGISYMPGRWGVGLESGFFSFDPSYNADEYRTGFEEYTVVQRTSDQWNSFYINAGPRFRFGQQLPVQFSAGLDFALSYKNPPVQSVEFNDPEGHFDDAQFTLANFEPEEGYSKWSAAIRPQLQLEFNPFRSNRIGFNLKTGIQHELSDREFTYTERDLSRVRLVPSAGEMFFQFENAREVERSVTAPKTNFFANAGIKISFGGSGASTTRARGYFEGDQQRTAAESPNNDDRSSVDGVPVNITHQGRLQGEPYQGDTDDIDINDDAIETANDYNSVRSNKRRSGRWDSSDDEILREAFTMARIVNPAGIVISAGQVMKSSVSENPLYEAETREVENPLYGEGQANDGNSDNNSHDGYTPPVQRFGVHPSSYCVSLSNVSDQALKTFSETGDITEDAADDRAADGYPGEILATHSCPIYGYRLLIIRPAGYSGNASERIIQVEKMNKSFHATWNEVSNLISNYTPNQIDYYKLPQNPGQSGERFCTRTGHMIPTDTDVYQVSLAHSDDYNGVTSVFADNNLELAPLSTVISAYNQRRDQGDALPPTCNYGCSGSGGGVVTNANNWADMNFGGLDFGDKDPRKPGAGTGGVDVNPGVGVDDGISAGLEPSYPVNLKPVSDELGFPEMMKSASFAISKRSDRSGRSQNPLYEAEHNTLENPMYDEDEELPSYNGGSDGDDAIDINDDAIETANDYNSVRSNKRRSEISGDGDDVIDINDDAARFHFELEINPIDPDDDGDGLIDQLESATYSISEIRNEIEATQAMRPTGSVYQWTYNLSSMAGSEEFPANGTLTVLFTEGKWHFDVQLDPNYNGAETGELLQNSSFGISRR